MKAFQFPLDTLLRVRRLREDQAKLELAQLLQAVNLQRQKLAQAENQQQRVLREWFGSEAKPATGKDYQLAQRYLVAVKRSIKEQKVALRQQESVIHEKQQQVRLMLQERKILELLREKKYQAYLVERSREAQKEADENALLRLGR